MPWRPLPRIAFGICIYPFSPSSPADLPLEIGDELYIIEQGGRDGDWFRGYLVAPPSLLAGLTSVKGQALEARVFSGIFPRVCVEVREVLGAERTKGTSGAETRKSEVVKDGPNGLPTPNGSATPSPTPLHGDGAAAGDVETKDVQRDATRFSLTDGAQIPLPLSPLSISSKDRTGPRPSAPVPMLKIGDETPTSAQEPLVDEIASCLREWHSTKLHELLLSRQYSKLDKMSAIVQRLDTDRRQLLLKVLTKQELKGLRESVVWDLVNGNKMLSGEVIVRNPQQRGRILTGEDSAIEITKLQSMMSLLSERPAQPADEHAPHHLFAGITQALWELSSPKTIAMYLCSKSPGQPLVPVSEVHAVNVSAVNGYTPDAGMRTLFTDLGAVDMGEGSGAGSILYLALKVIVSENLRVPVVQSPSPMVDRRGSTATGHRSDLHHANSLRSQRSGMFGSRHSRQGSESTIPEDRSPGPQTSSDGRKSPGLDSQMLSGKSVKRCIAAGLVRVHHILKQDLEVEQEVTLWSPTTNPLVGESPGAEGRWEGLLTELLPSRSGDYRKFSFAKPLRILLKAFSDEDPEALIRSTPTLLQGISQTRKMGFTGAPGGARSDIYLTLTEAFIPRHAFLSHPKAGIVPLGIQHGLANLQLTLEVRKSTGQRVENCIFPSNNSQGHTAWRTTAVERAEPWNLTIRLSINPEDVPGSHIVMSIADLPGFPFALCWMPLWNDNAFVRDGDHSLALYQYDEYTSSIIAGRGAYLALPWEAEKVTRAEAPLATLQLRTNLCSTVYSQDPNLLGLLKWREQPPGDLPSLLTRFSYIPEIEIVKLLHEVFDALFEILSEAAGSDIFEPLIFAGVVHVLGIVHDRRFKLAPLVDQYTQTRFTFGEVTPCLIRGFKRLLQNPTDPASARELRSTLKVAGHIIKLICVSRTEQERNQAAPEAGPRSKAAFLDDLEGIFEGLQALMRNPAPTLIGTKTLVVQHFHSWLPELASMMKTEDILSTASQFVDACSNAQGKLVLYRLVLIQNISQLDMFKDPPIKKQLKFMTRRWLDPYWGKTEVVSDQWREQVRLCCSVVAAQLSEQADEGCDHIPKLVDSYRALQAAPRQPKKTLSLLFPASYPFQTKPLTADATDFDETMVETAAVLASITNPTKSLSFDFPEDELAEFLFSALQVYISILQGEAYPPSWLSVHIYHHKSTMRSLEKLASILIDTFLPSPDDADHFNTELWRSFFDALIKLVGSEALALETFPEQKRRAVWKIAGDVREQGADLLKRTWEAIGWETSEEDRNEYRIEKLGGYQVQYVPGLVGPIVELCLSVHEGLRRVAVQILQNMIITEWTLSQDLSLIQTEVIECLDGLFTQKTRSDSMLQKIFVGELIELFEPLSEDPEYPLLVAVKSLVATIDELLDLLAAVYTGEGNGEIFRIMDTLHLMDFLKDIQKEDIFIRYVHQLAELQLSAKNFTEAGLALRLHADLYEWDPSFTTEELQQPPMPEQTAFERKEQLYFQMIQHYEEGQSWDNALGSYMELADQYEHNIFDFSKLARAQRAMATIYETINKGEREQPRFFRVVYRGFGFPATLRDKEFIFQGLPTDHTSTFVERLQEQHPTAHVSTSDTVKEDLEGQYLHVYNVSPQRDLTHPIFQRAKVSQSVRDYYLLSRPNIFSHTTKRKINDVSLREQTLQKDVYTTAETFPTILRRSEIIKQGTITMGPLEIAIERTTRKTSDLLALEKKVQEGEEAAITSLTEAVMLAVDPDSESSVAHYRQLLDSEQDSSRMPSDVEEEDEEELPEEKTLDPMQTALKNALLDYVIAVRRSLAQFSRSAHQATRSDLQQRFETTFAPELATLNALLPAPHTQAQDENEWDSQSLRTPGPSSPVPGKLSSPIGSISPKVKHDRRVSIFKRLSNQDPHSPATISKPNGRISTDARAGAQTPVPHAETNGGFSPSQPHSHPQAAQPERTQASTPGPTTSTEEKLQRLLGIQTGQFRSATPDLGGRRSTAPAPAPAPAPQVQDPGPGTSSERERSSTLTSTVASPILRQYEEWRGTVTSIAGPRPGTRTSSRATAEDWGFAGSGADREESAAGSRASRVGSVRKRLSSLGLGKKRLGSVRRTGGVVVEE